MYGGRITCNLTVQGRCSATALAPGANSGPPERRKGGAMNWEIALLLFLGMPFAILYWMGSGLGQLKRVIIERTAARRPSPDACV